MYKKQKSSGKRKSHESDLSKKKATESSVIELLSLLKKLPSYKVPRGHFRDEIHKMRYDSLLEFKLLHAKTFDWRSLSQDPMYAEIYGKLARVNWLGITKYDQDFTSNCMVREFYTGIITDKEKIPK